MTTLRLRYVHSFVDRHGHTRHYFRFRGQRWPLPEIGDPGFLVAYEACKAKIATGIVPSARVLFGPGTLGWAIEQFLSSNEYRYRAAATQAADRRIFDELRQHAGTGLLRDLRDRHVKAIRDHFRQTFSASRADMALGLLSVLWGFADEHLSLDLGANPTTGVRRVHRAMSEREPWPEEVTAAFEAQAGPELRLAMALLLYTGQRRSDVVKMKWSQFDGEAIEVRQQKTGEPLTIPCHRRLREALERAPRKSEFILVGERGGPLGPESLSAAFRRTLRRAGITGYSVHGLRKNAGIALADAGCDMREIMAILGHKTFAMALHYTKRANQKLRARSAMDKWEAAESGKLRNRAGGNP
ncbi:MAG: tyrosine-type recombinase/integrase [Xanthobacteraceae bacterium]